MCAVNSVLPFARSRIEVSVGCPHLPGLASDSIYSLPMAPCPPQNDGALPHYQQPLGGCVDPGQQAEAEMTWQELMSLAELQGLDADGEVATGPTFHGGSHYPAPDPYCLAGSVHAWHGHGASGASLYSLPYDGSQGCQLGPPAFEPASAPPAEPCCLSLADPLLEHPGPGYKLRGDAESDSGLSLDSSPAGGSDGYGVADSGGLWADFQGHWSYGGLALPPGPPLPPPTTVMPLQHPGAAPVGAPGARARKDGPSRDDRRAQALRIPLATEAIVNLPVDDFNELVSRHRLSDQQLALARDIRRRGKNKVAAQNCRQRKLENIARLEQDLGALRRERERLASEREDVGRQLRQAERKVGELSRGVLASLRDPQGQPYSPDEFSLQQSEDGGVFLVPRAAQRPAEGRD
ncbi:transcription factor NF-E2 45 kDa subunit-like isoform X2 [Heterodontus francisci]|uniref:transcription factor NF-E2 45 kDa subunit-like isoform X2 n=1 Tax=Heterodontus francisci TaxID=7792 RepID=UPI00355C66A4